MQLSKECFVDLDHRMLTGRSPVITPQVLGWLTVVSAITFVGSAAVLPSLLSRLPVDFLTRPEPLLPPPPPFTSVFRLSFWLLRNAVGLVLLLAGLLMLITPGQGLLTLLAGLWLMDIPGKTRLERRIAGRPKVLASINWIRIRNGTPPLDPPE